MTDRGGWNVPSPENRNYIYRLTRVRGEPKWDRGTQAVINLNSEFRLPNPNEVPLKAPNPLSFDQEKERGYVEPDLWMWVTDKAVKITWEQGQHSAQEIYAMRGDQLLALASPFAADAEGQEWKDIPEEYFGAGSPSQLESAPRSTPMCSGAIPAQSSILHPLPESGGVDCCDDKTKPKVEAVWWRHFRMNLKDGRISEYNYYLEPEFKSQIPARQCQGKHPICGGHHPLKGNVELLALPNMPPPVRSARPTRNNPGRLHVRTRLPRGMVYPVRGRGREREKGRGNVHQGTE